MILFHDYFFCSKNLMIFVIFSIVFDAAVAYHLCNVLHFEENLFFALT
jgi:hypothetical protein